MKIDKSNPRHWFSLLSFMLQAAMGLALRLARPFRREPLTTAVVLYGHKLNGNLLALHDHLIAHPSLGLKPVFLSMDTGYCKTLQVQGVMACEASSAACAGLLARADVLISSHGLHSLQCLRWFYQRLGMRFIDVWHGIPFKGFDADDFKVQRKYSEAWMASPLLAQLYVNRFGFEPERLAVTGYARTDRLVTQNGKSAAALRRDVGAPEHGPLVLFAPTWVQDDKGRSIYPFGCSEAEFLQAISGVAARHGGTVLMRAHLNSGVVGGGGANVLSVPQSLFPDTEAVLLAADVLVCDWSSIAFDYLVLERPTIFLDVPAPFAKGFSLGPEYRFGPVVPSLAELVLQLDRVLGSPEYVHAELLPQLKVAKEAVYEGYADGLSAQRCAERLVKKLPTT